MHSHVTKDKLYKINKYKCRLRKYRKYTSWTNEMTYETNYKTQREYCKILSLINNWAAHLTQLHLIPFNAMEWDWELSWRVLRYGLLNKQTNQSHQLQLICEVDVGLIWCCLIASPLLLWPLCLVGLLRSSLLLSFKQMKGRRRAS